MWPTCINNLTPFECTLSPELPKFIREAFQNNGIANLQEMFIPFQIIAILGKCGTETYLDCPNLPEWHVENSHDWDGPVKYFADIGNYYWFDFDLVDLNNKLMQFRVVFNEGDADCNDGTWGAVWDRNRSVLVANLLSTGDCEATIEAVSKEYIDNYQPHEVWLPIKFENPQEDPLPFTTYYAKDLELEKAIGLAMRWCIAYSYESRFNQYVTNE
ncbi:MAG: hypothetical protein AB4352_21995 [Hormoscilla sp.]